MHRIKPTASLGDKNRPIFVQKLCVMKKEMFFENIKKLNYKFFLFQNDLSVFFYFCEFFLKFIILRDNISTAEIFNCIYMITYK